MNGDTLLQLLTVEFFESKEHIELALAYTSLIHNISRNDIAVVLLKGKLDIQKYSDLSFVVRGYSTKDIKKLEKMGGKLNLNLKGGPGYIFSMDKKYSVARYNILGLLDRGRHFNINKVNKVIWNIDTILKNLCSINNEWITGEKIRKRIPLPRNKKDIKQCISILELFEYDKNYWPAEAGYMISQLIIGEKDVLPNTSDLHHLIWQHRNRVSGCIMYFIRGDEIFVNDTITKLYAEMPNMSTHYIRSGMDTSLYEKSPIFTDNPEYFAAFYHSTSD